MHDPEILRELHGRWRMCALCGNTGVLSLHHILKHPRDDVEANLVMLCGSGTTGCHGQIEAHDHRTLYALGTHLIARRPDTVIHLTYRLGSTAAAQQWFVHLLGN